MARVLDISSDSGAAIDAAVAAVLDGDCIVLPTDTVYGIGADAASPAAVQGLLDAKERGRDMPPPVLIAEVAMLRALTEEVGPDILALAEAFWPGALTMVVTAHPHLMMDLGDRGRTIAVRVPDHDFTRELLRATGPLAVSSANVSGQPAATTVAEARKQLGKRVRVYLDGGAGNDQLYGGDGNDTLIIDADDTVVQGGLGSDMVIVSGSRGVTLDMTEAGVERAEGGAGNDVFNASGMTGYIEERGHGGDDTLTGGLGNDYLDGGAGNDVIQGGAGEDAIMGGSGDDTLSGGDGSDWFFFQMGDGIDTIDGGAGGGWTDTIHLSDAAGGANIGAYGTDWTVELTQGSILSQSANELALSTDADGTITMSDGATAHFTHMERIDW